LDAATLLYLDEHGDIRSVDLGPSLLTGFLASAGLGFGPFL
jgi:hypothetical protein